MAHDARRRAHGEYPGSEERETPRVYGALATPGQGLEPQIRHPECRVLPITPSRIAAPRIVACHARAARASDRSTGTRAWRRGELEPVSLRSGRWARSSR